MPPRLPGEAAESAELQLLPERRGRRESRLSTLHALPPRAAPGHGLLDLSGTLADAAATLIEDGFLNAHSVDALARRVGVTERHLRRIFGAQFGVSPVEFAQTHRLLMAKRLLTDTALPVAVVASTAGFGSVRRFNDLFLQRYGLNPLRLRKGARRPMAT